MEKILIIRFSSIGDIIQCMSVSGGIKQRFPNAQLHWVTRSDMASLLKIDPRIDFIWECDRKAGLGQFLTLAFRLRKEGFTHVYDAHSNIRSNILRAIFLCTFSSCKWVTRYKNRIKRLLLFKFRLNLFPKPFRAFESFQKPLSKWGIQNFPHLTTNVLFPMQVQNKVKGLLDGFWGDSTNWIVLVPSAAWELKRWPVEYWIRLIELLSTYRFVVLGGPSDTFCEEIEKTDPTRVVNLAGKTSLLESFCVVYNAPYVISGDTGFLHAADLFDKPGAAIIGPTAFGFPTGEKMKVMEVDLPCRPCTKDGNVKCKLKEYKKCIMDVRPEDVASVAFDRKASCRC
ncbi:MAG: glycosyltransferase family 9 protein [Breznakibacter sp.]